jgi:hypothetical protein
MLVFINIFSETIPYQFTVGTVRYSRNNFPLYRVNPSLFIITFLCISLPLWLYILHAGMLEALVVQTI